MGNSFTGRFNSALGSNITYIANAYSHSGFIWLIFHSKELTTDQISMQIQLSQIAGVVVPNPSVNKTLNNVEINERVRVPFNDVHKKRRDTHYEFLTIFTKNRDQTDVTIICDNYKIFANRSFIVTNKGAIKESVYGGSVWEDTDAKYHKITNKVINFEEQNSVPIPLREQENILKTQEENEEKLKANKSEYNLRSSVNRFNSHPNETLSRYKSDFKELEPIGSGSFGTVYKVMNCLDRQQYAVKIIALKGIYKSNCHHLLNQYFNSCCIRAFQ
jgi:hypothetical protein